MTMAARKNEYKEKKVKLEHTSSPSFPRSGFSCTSDHFKFLIFRLIYRCISTTWKRLKCCLYWEVITARSRV